DSGPQGRTRGASQFSRAPGQARADSGSTAMTVGALALTLAVQISAPARLATIDVKGEPTRLAWSADGTQLALQTAERDKLGMMNGNLRFYLLSSADGKLTSAQAFPEWADKYWAWKSNNYTPWSSTTTIDIKKDEKTLTATSSPMGGSLAKGGTSGDPNGGSTTPEELARRQYEAQKVNVITLTLMGETVGYFEGMQFIPGYTFGWSPKDLASIAYVNSSGRLAVMDKDGKKQQVDGTKNVLLPAWSVDGTKIVFLQKAAKNKYELCVAAVTK